MWACSMRSCHETAVLDAHHLGPRLDIIAACLRRRLAWAGGDAAFCTALLDVQHRSTMATLCCLRARFPELDALGGSAPCSNCSQHQPRVGDAKRGASNSRNGRRRAHGLHADPKGSAKAGSALHQANTGVQRQSAGTPALALGATAESVSARKVMTTLKLSSA
jgi:hypothetical protein